MKLMYDYGLDDDGDLLISDGGDWVVVESTGQHQRDLILCDKGEFKENPTICVGADTYIDDEGKTAIIRAITQEFMKDGMEVKDLSPNVDSVADSTVNVFTNAFYK